MPFAHWELLHGRAIYKTNGKLSLALAGMDVLIHAAGCRDLTAPANFLLQSNIRANADTGGRGRRRKRSAVYLYQRGINRNE
jgi:hypothetical protein